MKNDDTSSKAPSPDYLKGYDYGYKIREHNPDKALSLSQIKFPETEIEYQKGLRAGIQDKELELIKAKGKSSPSKSKDVDIER